MDLKTFIKNTLINTCRIFTVATLFYCLLVSLVNASATEILLEATRIILFFFFALLVSLANSLLSVKLIPSAFRYILHFLLCGFAFYLCLLFPLIEAGAGGSFVIVGLSAYTLLYVIGLVVITIIKTSVTRAKDKKQDYTNRFS